MQNYHRHSSYSNPIIADSPVVNADYAKRAVELNHKVISSVEHGWQGNYFECYELAKKYDLKFIFGTEAYWVKDRMKDYPVIDKETGKPTFNKDGSPKLSKDRTNNHIILLAKTEKGRKAINRILSEANETGYYYRPRVDLELLLSLPPDDVMVTTACIAFWHYDDIVNIVEELHNHFKKNFYLEIQYHNTEKQKELNRSIMELSEELGIEMIVGLDSHYITEDQAIDREDILKAKKVEYNSDEDGWYMDYPDDAEVMRRFLEQGVFTADQIQKAMDATDVLLEFDDYAKDNPIFQPEIKLPSLFDGKHVIDGKRLPLLSQKEKDDAYARLIYNLFKKYTQNISEEKYDKYFEGVKNEVSVIRATSMSDYFLIDYFIVKRALEMGGVLTNTGRGSAVGYFTNTLLGFSKVDRFKSPITLYPERFISQSRILETKSLPDIDLNWGTPEIAEAAQKEILGEDHAYPMIAFGTLKKKSAFKLYARAQQMDFELANTISAQIEEYEKAYSFADDEDKEDINIYDFVEPEYHRYLDASKRYQGIIMDRKKAPCAYLLYSGSIREDIGLIKCKSEATKKEYITAVIDGAVAEKYKFLKNDLLKVDVVKLIDMVFKRAGVPAFNIDQLSQLVKTDKAVWDIYAKGFTIGVNQVERKSTTQKVMKYKPSNVSELSAFIAAIRPAFKSMYPKFENRENFAYGIPAFDALLQTEELPESFILYQEQTMNTLNYAGFPIDECYGIIKAIAKKHLEKVKPLKEKFISGFRDRIIADGVSPEKAENDAARVWQIISDSCGYGFNSAHAYCMALDSLYNAYLKAHYPYEFYEVLLQAYSEKGDKDKVMELKKEMQIAFGIKEGDYRFGLDNRHFRLDKENHLIYPSLLSIKGLSQVCAETLYNLSQNNHYTSFYDLWKDIKASKSVDNGQLEILININYFAQFGCIGKIRAFLNATEQLYERSQFNKSKLPAEYSDIIIKNSTETKTQYRNFDYESALYEIWNSLPDEDIDIQERIRYELEHLGYIKSVFKIPDKRIAYITDVKENKKSTTVKLHYLASGNSGIVKIRNTLYRACPVQPGDIIRIIHTEEEGRWSRTETGKWIQSRTEMETILYNYDIANNCLR